MTWVHMLTSESRLMPRSRREEDGVMLSEPIHIQLDGRNCWRRFEVHHRTYIFWVFSCCRLDHIQQATSSVQSDRPCGTPLGPAEGENSGLQDEHTASSGERLTASTLVPRPVVPKQLYRHCSKILWSTVLPLKIAGPSIVSSAT